MGRVRTDAMRYISPSGYRWRLRFHLGKRDEIQRSFNTLEEAMEARDNAIRGQSKFPNGNTSRQASANV